VKALFRHTGWRGLLLGAAVIALVALGIIWDTESQEDATVELGQELEAAWPRLSEDCIAVGKFISWRYDSTQSEVANIAYLKELHGRAAGLGGLSYWRDRCVTLDDVVEYRRRGLIRQLKGRRSEQPERVHR
jgi:hypothetical protein